jgi:glycosyltransferase involved in cell wall biosynthesis
LEAREQVDITVILCTYNRCQDLAKALESVAASELPLSTKWEILVVDNNSSDQTRALVEEFSHRNPGRFRYVLEPQPGKSHALNTGIREAQGEILAFMDDDVTVESAWLKNLTASLQEGKWVGAGGPVVLQWPAAIPRWLSKEGTPRHGFPGFDLGPEPKEMPCPPVGTNMAYRKSVFERFRGFNTDLGVSPVRPTPPVREDTELGWRLIFAGKRLRYEPSAVVNHLLPKAKMKKSYLLGRAFDKGRADSRGFYNLRLRLRLVFSLAAWVSRWMVAVKAPVRFYNKLVVWERAGTIREIYHDWRQAKKQIALNSRIIKEERANHLNLKAGEWVEVLSQEEIFATLDERGRLGNLPFMPEMLEFCGKQFRVHRRTDKTCDNIQRWSIRRLTNAVLLEGVLCNGLGHGGCHAGCMIFWKEAWLKRAKQNVVSAKSLRSSGKVKAGASELCTIKNILDASSRTDWKGETFYSCQATELLTYTTHMPSWDPRQYVRDLRSGNLYSGFAKDAPSHKALEVMLAIQRILRAVAINIFNTIQERRRGRPIYPYLGGTAKKTPVVVLNLQPGELVQVRSKEEIIATLDERDRNRGMLFDGAMLTFCGGIYRVARRVSRIVDEKTGKMMEMNYPCVVLEGANCLWDYHRLCPRDSCTPYWRENWLKRAVDVPAQLSCAQMTESCQKS